MKILLTGAFNYSESQIEYIKKMGHEVTFVQDERIKLPIDVSSFDAVICNGLFLKNEIAEFKSLKYIQLLSAGLDRVPLDYIKTHNISLFNARGVYSIPIAEFTLRGILDLYKNSAFFIENQKKKGWNKYRSINELYGKNALIVGAGSIGSEIAKRLCAFGVKVRGVDICPSSADGFEAVLPLSELKAELNNADIVILSLPLTDESMGMFNTSLFNEMKKSPVFVNIARGALVNESALINALEGGQLSGAVLDVFEEEPLSKASPLWDMENVIATPHNSFIGEGNNKRMFDLIIENLERFANE